MEVEEAERLKNTFNELINRLKKGKLLKAEIENGLIYFTVRVTKPHVTYDEKIIFPISKEFLEIYSFDRNELGKSHIFSV